MDVRPFHPLAGGTKNIVTSVASGNVQLLTGGTSPGPIQVRIFNPSAIVIFIRQGPDNATAASATIDTPIAPNSVEVMTFNVPQASDTGLWMAAIAASGTPTIYFTPGVGI